MDGLIAYALAKKYADEVGRSILDAGFKTQVEQDRSILKTAGQEKILYFIPKTTAKPSDGYDEYVYSNNAWEQVGATDVDLSSIDYNSLQNKPQIQFNDQSSVPIQGTLSFNPYEFIAETNSGVTYIRNNDPIFKSSLSPTSSILYDFNSIKSNLLYTGVFKIYKVNVLNLPQKFADAGSTIYVYHYVTTKTSSDLIRMVTYDTVNGVKMWSQLVTLGSMGASDNVQVTTQTAWVDLTNQVGYALTPQDKTDIANIVLQELPTTQGVLYGNESN